MVVTVPLGNQEGALQCSGNAAAARRSLKPGHMDKSMELRQNSLSALILVVPASIETLSDAFQSVNNNFDFRALLGGSSTSAKTGSQGKPPAPSTGGSGSDKSTASALSGVINANTITIAVVAAVTASVANVVAASTLSNSASLVNAFQIIGHAQCKCIRHAHFYITDLPCYCA